MTQWTMDDNHDILTYKLNTLFYKEMFKPYSNISNVNPHSQLKIVSFNSYSSQTIMMFLIETIQIFMQ